MSSVKHKITVTGPVVSFQDKEVSLNVALEVARLANPDLGVEVNQSSSRHPQNVLPSISSSEYLNKSKAKANTDKILVFARYIHQVLGKDFVTPEDIKIEFEHSREPLPGNFSRDLSRAINYGWLGESNIKKGSFYVTSLGIKTIETGFSKSFSRASRGKGGKLTPTVISESVKSLKIEPTDDEFPSYFSVSSKSDRLLWLVAKAKKLGIEKINQKEACFLSQKIGDDLPLKSISSYAESQRKKDFLATPLEDGTRYLRILEDGNVYLRSLKK